jgi:hypothetical protein
MSRDGMRKRAYGSGGPLVSNGVYFGKWRINDRQVKGRLGWSASLALARV